MKRVHLCVLFLASLASAAGIQEVEIPQDILWERIETKIVFGDVDPFVEPAPEIIDPQDAEQAAIDEFAPQRQARLNEASGQALERMESLLEGIMCNGGQSAYIALAGDYYKVGEVLKEIKVVGFTAYLKEVTGSQVVVSLEANGDDLNMLGEVVTITVELDF